MKKSNILLFTSLLIIWTVYIFLEPIKGYVFLDPATRKPRDVVSAIVQKFDKTKEIKNANLEGINHIKIRANKNNIYTNVNYADSTSVKSYSMNQLEKYDYKIDKDSLIISINSDQSRSLDLTIDPMKMYSLTYDGIIGNINMESADSLTIGINSIVFRNGSNVRISTNLREKKRISTPIKIGVEGQSRINVEGLTINHLDLELNDGLFILGDDSQIDSLNANLEGLSNIIIGKYPKDKRVKSLNLTGKLDYYNKRKPK